MGSAVGVRGLPGVVLMGGGGRKVVSRASQHVVGADFGECNVCSAEAGWRCRSELYGSVVGILVVVLSRIVGAMIADPATATTPVENATGRERELWNVPAPRPKWLMVGPRIFLQATDPLNTLLRVMHLGLKSCDL